MGLWFAALLGLVQGLTEFLPISSTAHLRITPTLLGQTDPGPAFTAVLQLGTLLAVFVYFARDLFVTLPRAMVRAPRSPEGILPWKLAAGTVPIVIAGLALQDRIEGDFRSLYVVAGALIGVGLLMAWIDRSAPGERGTYDLGFVDALLIGAAQAAALVPGVSRSGATICMALLLGMRRAEAARFSFLLGIPAIAGAGVFEMRAAIAQLGDDAILPLLVGTATAALSGYLSIAWLIRFLGTRRLVPFSVYRVALGLLLLALVISGTIAADAGLDR
jgi:undecaprenyl-diphosphatase